jgi:acyl-CoA reductase-like NAD-dependent aldehyde dehydrogenase
MDIINPATNKVITSLKSDTKDSVTTKIQELKLGQSKWAKTTLTHRLECIKSFRDDLLQNIDKYANDLAQEVGKPVFESVNEINAACERIDFFLNNLEKVLQVESFAQDTATKEELGYDPLGVIANISAWNYPYLVGVNVFIPAILCGNAVAYKPSEYSTLTGRNIEQALYNSKVPQDVFKCLVGDGSVGQALLDSDLDGYYFTGSKQTGVYIAQQVASKLVPVGLELGGKDPAYVTQNISNADNVAEGLVSGAFYNNGQSCCSVERIYVHESHYDEFVKAFVKHTQALVVGDPQDSSTTNGAITRSQHLAFLESQVKDAVSKGASLLIGGKTIESDGNFFEPTVLVDVSADMSVMVDESFGPIIGIQKVSSDEEAVKLMNDSEFGLTASVFTQDESQARDLMRKISAGNVYMNCCDRVSPNLPWAGRRFSGLGASLSKHGIYAFTQTKGFHFRK